ncbi:tRNA wybutosine-synthesizing protein 2/3/4 [Hypsibius exemplaris]|uniref:tRNA(Phe) (4-demethylwyosine(37)-C(7)) aminocarboxypropyltransferase n=1 Tax=Hypsibius exemplaris TaxID=2072580 RepID=A0A1W0WBU7_HYPEX|nr:tRNA wybutosine-synthesizing protein 2/3/4 [Hypsibius exemplaris]
MAGKKRSSPREQLYCAVTDLLKTKNLPCEEGDLAVIPRRWETFEDFILFPADSFRTPKWDSVAERLWPVVAKVFHVSRIARQGRIQANDFRSPRLELFLTTDTWVRKRENGIIYELDLEKSMFSSGNGTEKARMMALDCAGETVVDLFAGIGYFTIPILKADASKVFACEWNPDAVRALRRNIALNCVEGRCEIRFGDNREVAPVGVADRVILGLIPSSEISWATACRCLKPDTGGVLHVHANVDVPKTVFPPSEVDTTVPADKASCKKQQFNAFGERIKTSLIKECNQVFSVSRWKGDLRHVECVKSYGPNIFHCVFDIELRPSF